jgi:hypothetical protein
MEYEVGSGKAENYESKSKEPNVELRIFGALIKALI